MSFTICEQSVVLSTGRGRSLVTLVSDRWQHSSDDLHIYLHIHVPSYARYFGLIFIGPLPLLSYELLASQRSITEHWLAIKKLVLPKNRDHSRRCCFHNCQWNVHCLNLNARKFCNVSLVATCWERRVSVGRFLLFWETVLQGSFTCFLPKDPVESRSSALHFIPTCGLLQ